MLRPLPEGAWPLSTARYEQDMGVSRFGGLIIAVLVGEIYFYPFPLLFQELASLLLPALTNGAVRIVTAGGCIVAFATRILLLACSFVLICCGVGSHCHGSP